MNRYWFFRDLLDFVADHAEVIDAKMENCLGDIEVKGETDEEIVKICVTIQDKEEKNA